MEKKIFIYLFIYLFFCLLGSHLWPVEIPGLGVELKLQRLAYATATAIPGLSWVCDPYYSSGHCPILIPLSEAKDQTRILMDLVRFVTTQHNGNS